MTEHTTDGRTIMDQINDLVNRAHVNGLAVPTHESAGSDELLGPMSHYLKGLYTVYVQLTSKLGETSREMLRLQAEVRAAVPRTVHDDSTFVAWLAANPEMKQKFDTAESTKAAGQPEHEILKVVNVLLQGEAAMLYPQIRNRKDRKVPRVTADWNLVLAQPQMNPLELFMTGGAPVQVFVVGGNDGIGPVAGSA